MEIFKFKGYSSNEITELDVMLAREKYENNPYPKHFLVFMWHWLAYSYHHRDSIWPIFSALEYFLINGTYRTKLTVSVASYDYFSTADIIKCYTDNGYWIVRPECKYKCISCRTFHSKIPCLNTVIQYSLILSQILPHELSKHIVTNMIEAETTL